MKNCLLLFTGCLLTSAATLFAGEADVIGVTIEKSSSNTYDFSVTVAHEDTGWKHYANRWEVVDPQGTIIGTRTLHHPHVNEQPFTRSLSGVEIPDGVTTVRVRAHDLVHRYGGREVTAELPVK